MTTFTVASIQAAYNGSFNGTKSGSITDDKNGAGTYTTTVSHQGGVASFDQSITYANGKTSEEKTSITQNQDGSFQETVQSFVNGVATRQATIETSADGDSLTKTINGLNADGSTKSTGTETITANDDGTETIAVSRTNAHDKVSDITGTITQIAGGRDMSETITNAKGKTKTVNDQVTRNGNVTINFRTGTNFAQVAFSDTTTKTLLNTQEV